MLNVPRLLSLLIVISSIMAAYATYYFSHRAAEEQAATLSAQLTSRLDDQLTVLEGVRALYFTHKIDAGVHIRAYLRAVHTHARSTGIQGIGIVAATTPAQEPDRLTLMHKNYGPDARIWPKPIGNLAYPITFIEPYDTINSRALGFDMYSETIRRRAIQHAWTTGQASASDIVQLIQLGATDDPQPAFLLFLPITDPQNPRPLGYAELPQDSPRGQPVEALAYAPILIRDLMNALIAPSLSGLSGVQVYAGTNSAAPLVYTHGDIKFGAHETSIRVADKNWRMIVSYRANLNRYVRPLLVLLFGLATAGLVLRAFSDQRRRINAYRHLADEKARNAEDRELIIGEMAHRLKNAFARVGALSRITIRESQSLAEYEERFDGRLRALADTKQMMLTGGIATLNLAGLIQREMQMAGWDKNPLHKIDGPPVHLNEDGAQALGLIIHELVTNSIKYGALSGTGKLSVQWERQKRNIRLSWLEHDLAATPIIDQESFGTHFIRSLIQRQLRGDWQRTAEKRQLHVVITWPEENSPSGETSAAV